MTDWCNIFSHEHSNDLIYLNNTVFMNVYYDKDQRCRFDFMIFFCVLFFGGDNRCPRRGSEVTDRKRRWVWKGGGGVGYPSHGIGTFSKIRVMSQVNTAQMPRRMAFSNRQYKEVHFLHSLKIASYH